MWRSPNHEISCSPTPSSGQIHPGSDFSWSPLTVGINLPGLGRGTILPLPNCWSAREVDLLDLDLIWELKILLLGTADFHWRSTKGSTLGCWLFFCTRAHQTPLCSLVWRTFGEVTALRISYLHTFLPFFSWNIPGSRFAYNRHSLRKSFWIFA